MPFPNDTTYINGINNHYRPQTKLREGDVFIARKRSLGQCNIFAPVCHSVHRGGICLGACWETPPGGDPSEEAPPRRRPPRGGTPLRYPSPRHRACWEIQSTCGRYASYWNAILLHLSVILFTGWGGCIPACNGRGVGCLPLGPGGANLWSHSSLDLPLKWSKTILLFTSL